MAATEGSGGKHAKHDTESFWGHAMFRMASIMAKNGYKVRAWAQLIICRDPSSGSYRLTIPARRAAVDGTSREIIKRNFILLYCGLPLLEYTSLAAYQRFLKETKDMTSSIAFWKTQPKGTVPPVTLPWETGLSDVSVS